MDISQTFAPGPAFIDRLCPAPIAGGFQMEDYWIWCGSAIEGEDGRYHLFTSRWAKRYPMFSGYILHSEIVRAVADSPVGPFVFAEKVLPLSEPNTWDGRMAHNPTIRKLGDTFLLYYIGSTYNYQDGAEESESMCAESYANIRIGLATSKSVFGPWQALPHPILDTRHGKWDDKIVTNPAPVIHPDGKVLLYYRSNTPDGLRIGVAGANSFEGPYERLRDEPILVFPDGNFIEDPFVWWNGVHYEMLAKDMLGGISGEKHAGAHFRSDNGIDWEPMQPPKAYSRQLIYADGRKVHLGCLERPQLLFDHLQQPSHLYAAAADGVGGFRNASKTWNISIPIVTAHPESLPATGRG